MGTPAGEQSGLYTSRRILQKDARLLHRMVAGMDCHMVWIPKQAPTPLVAAIKMANHSIKIVHDPSRIAEADLVVATGDTLSEESLSGIPGLKLIWLRMPEKANPQSLLKGGFALNGRHRAVVMNNDSESTSRHIYSIL